MSVQDSGPAPAHYKRLNGWKEIAGYIGKSVRTAQRWEHELGLPVRRLGTGVAEIVFAFEHEIDDWQITHAGNHHLESDDEPASEPKAPPSKTRRRVIQAGIAILVILYAAFLVRVHFPRKKPSGFRVEGNTLIVQNTMGREIWRHSWQMGLNADVYRNVSNRHPWFGDLFGDGKTEMLFVAYPAAVDTSAVLYCFAQDGKELWHFVPGRVVRTASERFDPIYGIVQFAVADTPHGKRIIIAAQHYLYYPSQLTVLNPGGELVGEYWHSGHFDNILAIDSGRNGNITVYATGVNNEYRRATMVALSLDNFHGTSRQTDPAYQILDMPTAAENQRVYFARSVLNKATEPYNVARITIFRNGYLTVAVDETPGMTNSGAYLMYDVGLDGKLLSISPADHYFAIHKQLEIQGKLRSKFSPVEIEPLKKEYLLNSVPSKER